MRYFIHFSYDGRAYHGWQIQPNAISIQEVMQKALSKILRTTTLIVGAGRTDTGVSAANMVAHFDAPTPIDCPQLTYRLNRILPPDIAIHKISLVAEEAHARFDATSRTYHYLIHTEKDPFLRDFSLPYYIPLNIDLMNEGAALLKQHSDFTSFSKLHTDTKTNICHITEAQWTRIGNHQYCFQITANRFLRNMVRSIVGTLLDIGRGKLTIEDLRNIIAAKDRCQASESAPAHALSLIKIAYPNTIYIETKE